ncbi:MAG: hypothetical protein MZV70_29030 [Desulfobacterales bacterium]|nr:hypothetical protein [Desulfobacterales bacterium]
MGTLLSTVEQSVAVLKKVMRPEGFNVGLNLGQGRRGGDRGAPAFSHRPALVRRHQRAGRVRRRAGDPAAPPGDVALLKPHFEQIRPGAVEGRRERSAGSARLSGQRRKDRRGRPASVTADCSPGEAAVA